MSLSFVADTGGEIYIDGAGSRAHSDGSSSHQLAKDYGRMARGGPTLRGPNMRRPSTAPAQRTPPRSKPRQQRRRERPPPANENRPDFDLSPSRPTTSSRRRDATEVHDLSHLRPDLDQRIFDRDYHMPGRQPWNTDVRVPPDKGSPLRKSFRARPAPQPKLRFKGSPPKRVPISARKKPSPTGPKRRPKAEFMGVSGYQMAPNLRMDEPAEEQRESRIPERASVGQVEPEGTPAVVARALTSAQTYDVDTSAGSSQGAEAATAEAADERASPESGSSATSLRSESSPWGTLELRSPVVGMEAPPADTEVASATKAAAAPHSPPAPAPEPPKQPEPEPEPQPQPQRLPLFTPPQPTPASVAGTPASAQPPGWSEGQTEVVLTKVAETVLGDLLGDVAEKAEAKERQKLAAAAERQRAEEYAAKVLPAKARYEAALQQMKASEAAAQERWAVRRQQDTARLTADRSAVAAAAVARREQEAERGRDVVARIDAMRPKVVAYKEQYRNWYNRTYGALPSRQPSQTRRLLATHQAAHRLAPADTTELLCNHFVDVLLSDVAGEMDRIMEHTVDRVLKAELK